MNSIDQQFVEFVVKSLVSNPDKVSIVRSIDEKGVLLELTVDPEDLGRVIGKHGATAQSIRTLLRALGTKNDARYNLKIVDNGERRNNDDRVKPDVETVESDTIYDKPEQVIDEKVDEKKTADPVAVDRFQQTRNELAEFDDLDV